METYLNFSSLKILINFDEFYFKILLNEIILMDINDPLKLILVFYTSLERMDLKDENAKAELTDLPAQYRCM